MKTVIATFESGEDKLIVDMNYDDVSHKMDLGIKSGTNKSLSDLEKEESIALGVAMNFFEFLQGDK